VPFAAAWTHDIIVRLVAQKLAASLDSPSSSENRAGAGGNLGTDYVARARPDGYTLSRGQAASSSTP